MIDEKREIQSAVYTTTAKDTAHLLRYLADALEAGTAQAQACQDSERGPGEHVLILYYRVPEVAE